MKKGNLYQGFHILIQGSTLSCVINTWIKVQKLFYEHAQLLISYFFGIFQEQLCASFLS